MFTLDTTDTNLSEPAHGRPGSRRRSKRTDGRRLPHSRSVSFLDPCFTMAVGWCGNPNSSTVRSEQFWSSDRLLHVWRLEVLRNLVCSLECHCPPAGGSWILDAAALPISSDLSRTAPPRPAHSQGRPLTAPIRLRRRIHQREWTAHDKCLVFLFYFLQSLQLHLFRLAAAWDVLFSLTISQLATVTTNIVTCYIVQQRGDG